MPSAIKKNVLASYTNFVVLALLGLAVNPVLAGFLGPTSFGILKACQRLFDVTTAADGGAPQALKWVIAQESTAGDHEGKKRTVGAAIAVWVMWLPVLMAISAIVLFALPWTINGIENQDIAQAYIIGAALTFNVLLAGLVAIPASVLIGLNAGYRAVLATTVVLVLSNVAMVYLASVGFGAPAIAAVITAAAIITGAINLVQVSRSVEWWGVARPTKQEVSKLARMSGWVLGWSYVQRLLLAQEVLLISALIGASAVTQYVFSAYVVQFALAIALMTTSAYMPSLGQLLGKKDADRSSLIVKKTRELNLAAVTFFATCILLLNGSFVRLWAGDHMFLGQNANTLIVVAFIQLASLRMEAQLLDAALRVREKTLVGIVSCILGLIIPVATFFFLQTIEGLYLGIILGRLPAVIMLPMLSRDLGSPRRLAPLAKAAAIVISGCIGGYFMPRLDVLPLIVLASGLPFLIGLACLWLLLSAESRQIFLGKFLSRLGKTHG